MEETKPKLEWEDKYSVGVVEIDSQHQQMFETINQLIDAIDSRSEKDKLAEIIQQLVEYKKYHFETEEKYFELYKYSGAAEHVEEHRKFGEKLAGIQEKCGSDSLMLAFELVDFLEDWLIDHLMNMDQKYKECFQSAGLK